MASPYAVIVVGTDGSATARVAVARAADLAEASGAVLHVAMVAPSVSIMAPPDLAVAVTSYDDDGVEIARATLAEAVSLLEDRSIDVEPHVLGGDPASALLDLCEQVTADLLVVGNQGMRGAKRFLLGSVSSRCAHHAGNDVLIVHTS